ncbi:MAG: nicotinate phosphoribosyltransferase [Acidimicrobiia bacterium]|nr:nicotinate phosphoribosyltransferase [Acidimicrobiia bacterium]
MAAAYMADGNHGRATFELWVRDLGEHRNFLVAAGLDDALRYLEGLRFEGEALAYLRSLGRFSAEALEFLAGLRFTGEVWAMPEGTIAFAGEPLLRVTAPIIEAQLAETFLINTVGFHTLIASKAARVTLAAGEKDWVDFGARRAHGADAALGAARSAWLAGAAATSLVLAGHRFGIPVTGTMAHSYVLSHPSESEAFLAFARTFPEDAVLLIDTFDTVAGARVAVAAARELAAEGIRVAGVRLDSGDMAMLAREVRRILDEAGFPDIRILASGGLDEHSVAALAAAAPIDGFGVGTRLATGGDEPSLDAVYKLVQDASGPRMKTSTGKATLPGVKQVHRIEEHGKVFGDTIALADEAGVAGWPLLRQAMAGGRRLDPPEPLTAGRERCRAGLASLPEPLRSLEVKAEAPVRVSDELRALARRLGEAHPPAAELH